MSQQFITQLEQVCRRRVRRRWCVATCWTLALLLLSAISVMVLDRALGVADPIGRVLMSAVFVALAAIIVRRWLTEVASIRVTPLQVAHDVERRYPKLRDLVASAWEFAQQTDAEPVTGSESLRRAVVVRAGAAVADVDWYGFVPRRPLRRAAFALASIGILSAVLSWLLPQATAIGLTRLVNPFSAAEWPREHDLQIVDPPKLLAAGDDLVLSIRDTRGALPSTVDVHCRTHRRGRWQEETQSVAATTEQIEIRRPNVQQPLQFRATGGDHRTMPWQAVDVVAPPRVEEVQISIHPPGYTNLPTRKWTSDAAIYAGSDLSLEGRADQPVTQVVLRSADGTTEIPARVESDGRSFSIDRTGWRVSDSERYRLHLTTDSGITTRAATKIALNVVADNPPQVRFVEPIDDLTVLPTVEVPLVIDASDELAVRSIDLVYRRSDRSDEGEKRIQVWNTDDKTAVQRKQVDFSWSLVPLALEQGSVVEVHAQATDAQPAMGQTIRALRLSIVSEEQLWSQIVEQQAKVVEVLTRLLAEQRELREITTDWSEFPAWSSSRWANASHAALFRQRQITESITSGGNGVLRRLDELSSTIRRNGLLRPEAVTQLQNAQALLQDLVDNPLNTVEQTLSEIVRQLRRSSEQQALRPMFALATSQQDEVLDGLRRAIDSLMPGNVLGRLEQELATLEADQKVLLDRCQSEIAPQILQANDSEPAQPAQVATVVRRQRELARRLAEFLLNLSQASHRMADQQPTLAGRLAATASLAKQLGTQATIGSAADQLARRRLGRSSALQLQVLDDLAKLRARLAGQDREGAAERFQRLQETERQLQRLRRKLQVLERELRERSPEQIQRELQRLRRQREALAQETEALARRLERLRLPSAAKPARQAAAQLQRGSLDSETTKQARQRLDVAQQQLTAARRRQQVALARLEMARLDAKLKALVGRQESIQREIVRLASIVDRDGRLSDAQSQSVLQLADQQADLREEALAQAEALTSLPVFVHLLKLSSETMQSVEDQLRQSEVSESTQVLVDRVVQQLSQLAEAVQQERQNLAGEQDDSGGGGQGQSGDTAQGQTLQLALGQLKLLKALQSALRQQTKIFEEQQAADGLLDERANELARQQQQLTELARQLTPEPPDPPTEELFPNLEEELERSFDDLLLPRTSEEELP